MMNVTSFLIPEIASSPAALRNDASTFVIASEAKQSALGVFCFLILALLFAPVALANNLNISNVSVASQDTSADTLTLQFDISWDNSWYDSTNRDAAWVFAKYSTDGGTVWSHATLKTSGTTPSGFSTGSGTSIDIVVAADKKGAFIQRNAEGSGTLSNTSVKFVWDYAADGLTDASANSNGSRFKFFGIEMVFVSQGGFYLGDGTNGTNGEFLWEASIPGVIDSETNLLTFESSVGTANAWYYTTDTGANDAATAAIFTVSSAFPKGYQAFYAMKYEVTQMQYKNFLNTLSRLQQINRVATNISGTSITNVYVMTNASSITNRNIINCPATLADTTSPVTFSSSVSSVEKGDRACNYLSWMDLAAYLDWAALRPMTELEYEKMARGPLFPVAAEYAWGSTSATVAATISGTENGTETITASANGNYNSTTFTDSSVTSAGPLRAGIYATSSNNNNTRVLTGASYYGIMELTANVWERAVSAGVTAGRGYAGSHGDGVLISLSSYEGNATNMDWPGLDATSNARGITGATGSGLRGGGWAVSSANLAARASVSSRYQAGTTDTTRGSDYGGRGVRTASA